MENKYVIFCKDDFISPIQLMDGKGNSLVRELSKDDAEAWVNEQNIKCGEDFYWYEKLGDWQERIQSPKMNDFYEEMDNICGEVYKQLMESEEMKEFEKNIYNNLDKNINGFQIPFVAENNKDYEAQLKEKLTAFKNEIAGKPAFQREGNLVDDVNNICDKVIMAFEAAKSGKKEIAEKIISEILQDYKQYDFAVSELDRSYAFRGIAPFNQLKAGYVEEKHYENMMGGDLSFFRARVVSAGENIHSMEDINYLPYIKRGLSKDMRFSSKGKICLYLGTTSYVCSEECRWNENDNLYISSFKFNEKGKRLKILNLVVLQALMNGMIPRDENDFYRKKLHSAMVRVFPLVISTMFTIKTSDEEREKKYHEKVKYEYLLSQIVMNALHREGIDGVAYLSRQGKNDFQYPQMVCLALPVTDNSDKNEYGSLINCYEMTSPVLFNCFNDNSQFNKRSYINEKFPKYKEYKMQNYTAKVNCKDKDKDMFYQDTRFSRMDDYMVNQEHMKAASMQSDNVSENRGMKAMKEASRIAADNGISDMALDEINAEISEARR